MNSVLFSGIFTSPSGNFISLLITVELPPFFCFFFCSSSTFLFFYFRYSSSFFASSYYFLFSSYYFCCFPCLIFCSLSFYYWTAFIRYFISDYESFGFFSYFGSCCPFTGFAYGFFFWLWFTLSTLVGLLSFFAVFGLAALPILLPSALLVLSFILLSKFRLLRFELWMNYDWASDKS